MSEGGRDLVSDEVLADQLFIPKARDRQELVKKTEKALVRVRGCFLFFVCCRFFFVCVYICCIIVRREQN